MRRRAPRSLLDCFVAVPSGDGAPMDELQVPFGDELVHYAVGASSCAVPGVPAGLDALWRAHGRLPWARLVEPALRLARSGVEMPPAHASCLAMLAPVMTMREGAAIYAPGGALLESGDLLVQPGLVAALELVRDEGASSVYRGSIAEALVTLVAQRDGVLLRSDLESYEARWSAPSEVAFAGRRVATRAGLSGVPETLARFDPSGGDAALLAALDDGASGAGHTTNLTVVDADGSACVLTTSLGLGSGDFLPGLDLHLNSMLGETDLVREPLRPGRAHGEHDGADRRLRRRRPRARARRRRRHASAHGARRRARPGAARRSGGARRDRPAAVPSRRPARERRAGRGRGVPLRARSGRPRRFAGGPRCTTTSVGSARSAARAPERIRDGAEQFVCSADAVRPARRERRLVFRSTKGRATWRGRRRAPAGSRCSSGTTSGSSGARRQPIPG